MPLVFGQAVHQRNRKRKRLSAACLPPAENITTGEGVGQGLGLNPKRPCDSAGGEHSDEWCAHIQIGEVFVCNHFSGAFRASVCLVVATRSTRGRSAQGGEIAGEQNRSPRDELCRMHGII